MIKETLKIVGSLIAIAIVAPFLWWSWTTDIDKTAEVEMSPAEKKTSDARYACREAIAKSLHNPDSAEWGMRSGNWYASWPAQVDGDTVTVRPTFRASNAMGATILTSWHCKVRITETEWTLLELTEI